MVRVETHGHRLTLLAHTHTHFNHLRVHDLWSNRINSNYFCSLIPYPPGDIMTVSLLGHLSNQLQHIINSWYLQYSLESGSYSNFSWNLRSLLDYFETKCKEFFFFFQPHNIIYLIFSLRLYSITPQKTRVTHSPSQISYLLTLKTESFSSCTKNFIYQL